MFEVEQPLITIKKKDKRANPEKRKEKSRDAARSRRSKESEYFNEINSLLPIPRSITSTLDKSASLRLFVSYLKLRQFFLDFNGASISTSAENLSTNRLYSEAIDGFVLLLTLSGNIVFLSENVKTFLGVSQIDMLGHSLYDFSHPCDHDEISNMLTYEETSDSLNRLKLLRMRCTPSKRETKIKKSYKVMRCVGRIVKNEEQLFEKKREQSHLNLISIASPIPHPSNINILLDQNTFLTRHNLDMKFTYIDSRVDSLLQYKDGELINNSIYTYIHAADICSVRASFQDLFKKGQCDTELYRFMVKNGGFVWIVTQATLIYGNKTPSFPQCVVCVHYVNSGVIDKDQVYSKEQLKDNDLPASASIETTENHVPLQSTDSIFSPRTQDMNTGYLSMKDISAELQVTEYKDDPDDLTHLAPTAGDACIPLDIFAFPGENLEDWMLMDTPVYQKNASINETNPMLSNSSPLRSDPFLSYREDISLCHNNKSSSLLTISTSSSDSGSDSNGSIHSPQELLDGTYSLPLEDFPALSVTDNVIWNNNDGLLMPLKDTADDDKYDSTKCSSLAKLLQSETHNMYKMAQFSSVQPHNCEKSKNSANFKDVHSASTKFDSQSELSEFSRKAVKQSNNNSMSCDKLKMKRNSEADDKLTERKRLRKDQAQTKSKKQSVLMSLLLDGHNEEYDYKAKKTIMPKPNELKNNFEVTNKIVPVTLAKLLLSENPGNCNSMNQLKYLTHEDAEVNAPIPENDNLLSGKELLNALDENCVQTPYTQVLAT